MAARSRVADLLALERDVIALHRARARERMLPFVTYTMPGYRPAAMHRLICEAVERVDRGESKRVMILTPPRHGKSELVSRRAPAWLLGRRPDRQIISASYGADLASDFGRDARNIIASPEYREIFGAVDLAQDSQAKNRWHTTAGGSYVAAGVGTAITGRGADILNIDDPVKSRAEAESETTREATWSWYRSTAYTRLMPGGAVILTMTRWHEDDLGGRLLAEMASGGDQWEVLRLPALAVDDDPLGRQPGDALWPEAYDRDALDRVRMAIGERDWSALYQQDPRPPEGALFKVERGTALDAAPAGIRWVRAWDLAATAQTGTRDSDWTVGLLLGRTDEGRFVIGDVVRLRGGPDEVEAAVVATASRDGRGVPISLPQDPGQAGKAQVLYLTRKLAGYRVSSSTETGDKSTRAMPVAAQCNGGNLAMVRAPWNAQLMDELRGFPSGAHDDQVDALSRAFGLVGLGSRPLVISDTVLDRLAAGGRY
jgi:predicted phage terminase large subunit-like protein